MNNCSGRIFFILALVWAIFGNSTEVQARAGHEGGRLIMQRTPNFGTNLVIHLSIDGKKVANIPRDHRYDGFVSAGQHVLTVLSLPNIEFRRPTSMRLTVRSGHTYIFTAAWDMDRLVLRRSTSSNDATRVP